MANISFITGGELEIRADWMWHGTGLGLADPPASGVPDAHGKVYDLTTWSSLAHPIASTPLVTIKTRWRFENDVDNEPFLLLNDGILNQVRVVRRSDGSVQVVRQTDVLATSATGLFVPDTNYEIEWRARISNGSGSIALNRNGSQIICLPSGVDTQTTGTGHVNSWVLGNEVLGSYFDDCVVDRSGAYVGTGEVETLMPNGAGLVQLSPDSIGVANYTRVNEKPHDSDTTYVVSTGDQTDTYQFENRSLSGTPLGVMLACVPRLNPSVGDPGLRLVCRIDGENFESPTFTGITSTYRHHKYHAWAVNPATGEPWTDESINAAEWGVHCLAAGIRITQVGLLVYVRTAESDQCLASGASRDYCQAVNEDLN